ncbi:MAG: XRE family transcriptional regulator [Lachnospiraceae bacterium]|nr:XRE family transcriptional regulator [Lachnospiraceae bacterium]
MTTTWNELKKEINLSEEEAEAVKIEEKLIETMIHIREEQNMSQAQLGKICNMKQPAIARLEKKVHSPQLDSILKILVPLGYTLEIVPLKREK